MREKTGEQVQIARRRVIAQSSYCDSNSLNGKDSAKVRRSRSLQIGHNEAVTSAQRQSSNGSASSRDVVISVVLVLCHPWHYFADEIAIDAAMVESIEVPARKRFNIN